MKLTSHNKKRCLAWLLLFALCFQRLIGLLGVEAFHAVVVELQMNGTEEAIADKIIAEIGQGVVVQIQDSSQVEYLKSLGYAAPFIFSESIDSQTCQFTIEYPPRTILINCDVAAAQSGEKQPQNAPKPLNDKVLSPFFFWEDSLPAFECPTFGTQQFAFCETWENPFISILSPPPKMVRSSCPHIIFFYAGAKSC